MDFILSQVFGGIALLLSGISYFVSSKRLFLFIQLVLNIFYALSFIIVGIYGAGFETILFTVLVFIVYYFEKMNEKVPILYLFVFSLLYIIVGIMFFKEYIEIIPICTSIIFTAVIWLKEMQTLRYFLLIPNALLVAYDIICSVYTTAILDFLDIVMLLSAIVTWHIKNKRQKSALENSKQSK